MLYWKWRIWNRHPQHSVYLPNIFHHLTPMMKFHFLLCLILWQCFASAQSDRLNTIDIQSYQFTLVINDSTNVIKGEATIVVRFKKPVASFALDLVKADRSGKGMTVDKVQENGKTIPFDHEEELLKVDIGSTGTGETRTYLITYHGIPADGLIIGKNKYGKRTFFGDNWPNRAHNWLPCVDHPADKAFVEFEVTAPAHYQVVANGALMEEINLPHDAKQYLYKTAVPLPTKVMVIGAAEFAVQNIGEVSNVPLSSWVYPKDKDKGFYDYSVAKPILAYFIDHIGPYPFEKLANVQSTTRFGGMENAGNIFYYENSISGHQDAESLIAHEIAHQWFGNSASETDWSQLWLSEGFATYFSDLYLEFKYGRDSLNHLLEEQREQVIQFYRLRKTPVVDSVTTNYLDLLNPNSYQKGGWILHMLRRQLGDATFWKGIRAYYAQYKLSNASTQDFMYIMEKISRKDLDTFFKQWLFTPGHPQLAIEWTQQKKNLELMVEQKQTSAVFQFPLEVKIAYADGSSEIKMVEIARQKEVKNLKIKKKAQVVEVVPDPNVQLLFE